MTEIFKDSFDNKLDEAWSGNQAKESFESWNSGIYFPQWGYGVDLD